MLEVFRQLRASSRRSPVGFWGFVIGDVCRSVVRLHVDATPFFARWMTVCAVGAIAAGFLANAFAWCVAYFYHPYLEGMTVAPWSYGALLGVGLGVVQGAALQPRFRLGVRWALATVASAAIGLQAAVTIAGAAGPIGCGLVLGSVVGIGQWLVLHTQAPSLGWWAPASAVALAASVLSYGAAMQHALAGMNPIATEMVTLRGLQALPHPAEAAVGIAIMATTGLVIGALTAKPISLIHAE
ncbi:MAG: hypothetical protein HY047_02415 [Acidobacteria bacterium]|nr:hypothetical protein [Acidobacteriota bacterium]